MNNASVEDPAGVSLQSTMRRLPTHATLRYPRASGSRRTPGNASLASRVPGFATGAAEAGATKETLILLLIPAKAGLRRRECRKRTSAQPMAGGQATGCGE